MSHPFLRQCRPALGTLVEVGLHEDDLPHAPTERQAIFDAAFSSIERVQRLMSVHDATSDLSRVNRLAHRQPVPVDTWTAEVLKAALAFHAASGGQFDCAVGRRLSGWGLLPDGLFADANEIVSMAHLRVLDDGHVTAERPLDLDLGGIAKGYAVDKAVEALRAAGVENAIVNAGGDLRVIGTIDAPIHVRDPRQPELLHPVGTLSDGALATSAIYFSASQASVANVSALVDPCNGQAVRGARSYSVIAPDCMTADALTKVLAVCENADHPCFARYGAQTFIL